MKRITFIIYVAVISATLICAFAFKQYVNIHLESLIPLSNIGVMLYAGYQMSVSKNVYYKGKWRTYGNDVDFKYSKDKNGKGRFEVFKPQVQTSLSNVISSYTVFIGASLNIPLIVFGGLYTKLWSFGIFLIVLILGAVLSFPFEYKENKKQIEADEARKEQWERELEEQKKREEMGRWK